MKTVFDEFFPDILYSAHCYNKKICLVCGSGKAITVLRTTTTEVFPLCVNCNFNWNFYGYEILKKVKPKTLLWNLCKFKLRHPWWGSMVDMYRNLKVIKDWSAGMKNYLKRSKNF